MRRPSVATFQAQFEGKPIFEAMAAVKGGGGEINALPLWELQAMAYFRIDEADWIELPIPRRARMVCTVKLPEWLNILESDRVSREMKANSSEVS
ncbi:MAG: hypothetical protein KJ077_10455 [Anaerolineae bacterium]|nr:hypothetical protein [Anaerolineae bacterium]